MITVVEPEGSWFDLKLYVFCSCNFSRPVSSCRAFLDSLSTYLVVTGILGGLGFYVYSTLAPQPKKRKSPQQVSAPVGVVTATGAGGYQEEWIPEHHLKKSKKTKATGAASGDETSGIESGTEGKRRKAKK